MEQATGAIEPAAEQTNSLLHHDVWPGASQAPKDRGHEGIRTVSDSVSPEEAKNAIPSRQLKHFPYILWLAIGYTVLAVFAWAIIVILVYRPITTRHYGLWLDKDDLYEPEYPLPSVYTQIERWYQAARVIQAIVAVVTIPLASAVCSNAAVTFVQRASKGAHLSLRQTMALADRGWFQYDVYTQLLRGHWKRYGSTLLYLALTLHLLGGIIAPLQSVFTSTTTKWTPRYPSQVQSLTDISTRFRSADSLTNTPLDAANLRYALTSTTATDPQSRLWTASGAVNCTSGQPGDSAACSLGQLSLQNMSQLEDPFFAQLQAGFSTGLIRQYLPRISSSASRVEIPEAEFPSNCLDPKSFYVNYSTAVNMGNSTLPYYGTTPWTLIACMPGDQTRSPWTETRQRQGFTEELYLNLSARVAPREWSGFYKITMNTTAGFFELPNHMNGGIPGPLLSGDPTEHCDRDCILQNNNIYDLFWDNGSFVRSRGGQAPAQYNASTNVTGAAFRLEHVKNKGPLLTTALALFGAGSWVAERVQHPGAYVNKDVQDPTLGWDSCTERPPFDGLLLGIFQNEDSIYTGKPETILCVSDNVWDYGLLQIQLAIYVRQFISLPDINYGERIENAFEAAAFLANELWLASASEMTWTVSYDQGAGIQFPKIPVSGIVLISLLLGIYLLSLLAMAIYSNWEVHWTGQLDSFAMMRLGASIAEHLPLSVAFNPERVKFLDGTHGWIGDATGGEGEIGELALGAPTTLHSKRRYSCYEQESDPEEKKKEKKEKKEREKKRERERTERIINRYNNTRVVS